MKCMWKRGCAASQVFDRWGLVGAVVVADQVHVQLGGNLGVDLGQELLELDGPVPAVHRRDHGAVSDVERGEQAGDAVPDVVVGAALGHARHHRQHRLRAVQGLDLGLLVHAEHHRLLGRVQVQPDDVADLVHELRVGGQLERVRRCGLSSNARQIRPTVDFDSPVRSAIDARDQCVALAGVDSNVATIDVLDLIGGDRRRTPRTRLVDQPVQALLHEPGPPLAHRRRRHPTSRPPACCPRPPRTPARSATATPGPARTSPAAPSASSCSRSSSVSTNTAFGRPERGIPHPTTYPQFTAQRH